MDTLDTIAAFVWAKYQAWDLEYAGRDVASANTIARLCVDPVSADDGARQTKTFEVEAVGTLTGLSERAFAGLTKGAQLLLCGEIVYVTKRLSADLIEIYSDSRVAYEIVARNTEESLGGL
jgi:hypothetical protein